MRKLVVCLGTVLSLAIFAASSRADIVVDKTSTAPVATFNGSNSDASPITVTLGSELFTGPNDLIKDITVFIDFSKESTGFASPKFNEISFSLTKDGTTVKLINAGGATSGNYTGTFTTGLGGTGFDGILAFNNKPVGPDNPIVNPLNLFGEASTITAGTYRPADTNATGGALAESGPTLAAFFGTSGTGVYTLNVSDSTDIGADPGLTFKSFSVSVTAVPEPTSLACLGLLATAGAFVRRRRVR